MMFFELSIKTEKKRHWNALSGFCKGGNQYIK